MLRVKIMVAVHSATIARLRKVSKDEQDCQKRIQEYVALGEGKYDGSYGCPWVGNDADGRPLFAFDVNVLIHHPDPENFHTSMMKYVERVTNEAMDPMAGHLWVWSASNVKISDFWARRKLWQHMMAVNEHLFPGLLHKMIIYDVTGVSRKVVEYIQYYMLKPDVAARFELYSGTIQDMNIQRQLKGWTNVKESNMLHVAQTQEQVAHVVDII